jgi:hypothetical protein
MFSKLVLKLFKETTNISDISPVTFNTPGAYNPRYGKQKVYVTGRGGTGTTTPGNVYDNSYTNQSTYTPGNYYSNAYTNAGTYTSAGVSPGYTNPPTYVPSSYGTIGY